MTLLSPEECGRRNALGTPNTAFRGSVVSILALERSNHCVKKSRLGRVVVRCYLKRGTTPPLSPQFST